MPTDIEQQEGSVITEAQPEVTTVGGKTGKKNKSGNLILDVAHEIETMEKGKAQKEAERLATDIEVNYFKLGGVLKIINENEWFGPGISDLDTYVYENFGFQGRKARYLIDIYTHLVNKMIPWEKVSEIGWTKLKDLAAILTLDNLDYWVEMAKANTVAQLNALIQAHKHQGSASEKSEKVIDDIVKRTYKFKGDQVDVVDQAVAKAKGELGTEFDTVALENICAGFLGGNSAVPLMSIDEFVMKVGFEPLLLRVSEMFPDFDIKVEVAGSSETTPDASTDAAVPTAEVVAAK